MAWTTTGSLADSLPVTIDAARLVREYEGVMVRLAESHNLSEGDGLAWNESSLAALTAAAVTELTVNENFQALSDTLLSIAPSYVQVVTLITKRTKARISGNVNALIGVLGQNAMNRKKDQDLLTVVQAASTDLGTAGQPMTSAQITAAVARAQGNANEATISRISSVLHNYAIKDIEDEVVSGVGTYPIPVGLTDKTFREGFSGSVGSSEVFHDGNINIDGATDSQGATFATESLVLVNGLGPDAAHEDMPRHGGGAEIVTLTDEYGIGERSAGNWMFSHTSDATAPVG